MTKTVLLVVAHSDDEALGCGGSIARHVAAGDKVFAISMTDGVAARNNMDDLSVGARQQTAAEAAKILGFTWHASADFPDNQTDSVPLIDLARFVETAKSALKPDLVYTHSAADLNIDHRRCCEAVLTAFRPQPGETCREIRCFETASATDYGHDAVTGRFSPNLFIDIAGYWDKKRAALEAYAAEMRPTPHSRSVQGLEVLARQRGMQNGLEMAEAFEILRKIES